MRSDTLVEQLEDTEEGRGIPQLCELAATGLVGMLDPKSQIFCDIYHRTEEGMVRTGQSPRYTLMTLLGLHRYEQSGRRSPVALYPVLNALLHDTSWIDSAGDLGLLLWACAELVPERLPAIYQQVGAQDALERFADGRLGSTMQVAWYLTGVAACYIAGHDNLPKLAEQVVKARQILEGNCGASGVYRHLGQIGSLTSRLRGRIGSFADQVYPTIAFARLARALGDEKARQMALKTAKQICQLQGPLGEWFWHYDSVTGRVISRYPIFSVHQHAMGPMMLFAASEATGVDFSDAIVKGLAWISGKNEIGRDFIEPSLSLVWRCIYLDSINAYADAMQRFLRLRNGPADARRLKIRYECRPYELGWLLYAFSGK